MSTFKKSFIFIFPGQGSQSVGMGKYLFENFKIAKNVFEEASDSLKLDVQKLCFEGDEARLALTENTQPALLTVSYATAKVLKEQVGIEVLATAGHSIGEYSSLVLGNVLSFSDAIKSVRNRGLAMQSAVPVGEGGMTAALGLTEAQTVFLCQWVEKETNYRPLSPANYNCDGQIVISGNLKALNWLKENFNPQVLVDHQLGEARRAKLIPLQVSAPFHCQMMKPAENKMRDFFKNIQFDNSDIPVLQNFTATFETEGSVIKENLIRQISAPVLWTQSMLFLKKKYAEYENLSVIECGQGQVLKGLLKKIDPEYFKVYSTGNLDDLNSIEQLLKA